MLQLVNIYMDLQIDLQSLLSWMNLLGQKRIYHTTLQSSDMWANLIQKRKHHYPTEKSIPIMKGNLFQWSVSIEHTYYKTSLF